MVTTSELQRRHLLLVEGKNDLHVMEHIARKAELPRLTIKDAGSDSALLTTIPNYIRVSNSEALGIVLDANSNVEARWQSFTDRIRVLQRQPIKLGPLPPGPNPQGTIIAGKPRVGLWLMPDNRTQGELEDFIARMIPASDPVWPKSQAYIDGIPEKDRKFKQKVVKAKVHAWLATLEEPRPMGQAIGTSSLDVNTEICQAFMRWMRDLFVPETSSEMVT